MCIGSGGDDGVKAIPRRAANSPSLNPPPAPMSAAVWRVRRLHLARQVQPVQEPYHCDAPVALSVGRRQPFGVPSYELG